MTNVCVCVCLCAEFDKETNIIEGFLPFSCTDFGELACLSQRTETLVR